MRRKHREKRELLPDPKHGDVLITKFINYLMWDGKKTTAQKVLYDCFDIIEKKTKKNPLEIFDLAFRNVSPQMELKSRRVGGANYQVPREVKGDRRFNLASRWILQAARKKKGMPMSQRLADELLLASNNEGAAVKKKMDVHKMADANRAFAHFG